MLTAHRVDIESLAYDLGYASAATSEPCPYVDQRLCEYWQDGLDAAKIDRAKKGIE